MVAPFFATRASTPCGSTPRTTAERQFQGIARSSNRPPGESVHNSVFLPFDSNVAFLPPCSVYGKIARRRAKAVAARHLSVATMRTIRQNLLLAFLYNVLAIPVAAGILDPLAGITIGPIWAAAAMSFSSLSVIANSLRLRNVNLSAR
jgi:hypothetical protein